VTSPGDNGDQPAVTSDPPERGELKIKERRSWRTWQLLTAVIEIADLTGVQAPILGLHGADDPISPLAQARARYGTAITAELVSIAGGRHDALNDQTHRTAAATVVLFLERLRQEGGPDPIAVREQLAAGQP